MNITQEFWFKYIYISSQQKIVSWLQRHKRFQVEKIWDNNIYVEYLYDFHQQLKNDTKVFKTWSYLVSLKIYDIIRTGHILVSMLTIYSISTGNFNKKFKKVRSCNEICFIGKVGNDSDMSWNRHEVNFQLGYYLIEIYNFYLSFVKLILFVAIYIIYTIICN